MKDISSGKCEEQKQTCLLSAIEVCTVPVASLVCVHTLSHLKDVLSPIINLHVICTGETLPCMHARGVEDFGGFVSVYWLTA